MALSQVLLEHNADPNLPDQDHWPALIFAVRDRGLKGSVKSRHNPVVNSERVQTLIDYGAYPFAKDDTNKTVLMYAAEKGEAEVTSRLARAPRREQRA